ncbi:MAG TPA: TetR/AcrR family transcriptional regulator [Steroidobacteraceae bacterium]|nr:TetR/AcrR family transcriptional regulator [Steroidobacteraceae bacterium]
MPGIRVVPVSPADAVAQVGTDNNVFADNYDVNDNIHCYRVSVNERPYHHGNLRAALLAEAERTMREQGIEQLSLRELARQAGVSHAAPRRHFADRQALLDALAEAGFLRLDDELRTAIDTAGDNYQSRLRAAATAYIRFATRDAALLELMYVVKRGQHSAALDDAFGRLFTTFNAFIRQGQHAGELHPGDPDRVRLLLFAVIQGIAALVTSGSVDARQTDELIGDTVALFTRDSR